MKHIVRWPLAAFVAVLLSQPVPAAGQTAPPSDPGSNDWKIAVYPVLAWVPINIGIDVSIPPIEGSGGAPERGEIIDSRFDGAFFGGFSAANGKWRIDVDGLWAGVGGDRVERPALTVDVDAVYGHASGGREIIGNLYATVGVRRMALKYDVLLNGRAFSRDPGVWDPLIGAGWHQTVNSRLELHVVFEGGGFGVGADRDLSGSVRFDWKPVSHFGITGGYSLLHYKLTHTVQQRTFTSKQTMHGPVVGIGLYF